MGSCMLCENELIWICTTCMHVVSMRKFGEGVKAPNEAIEVDLNYCLVKMISVAVFRSFVVDTVCVDMYM